MDCEAEEEEEEASASLCARLAAVEMLLRHAETTEARLRAEFTDLLSNELEEQLVISSQAPVSLCFKHIY